MIQFEFLVEQDGSIHFEKHGVSVAEIDEAFNDRPYLFTRRPDGSFVAFSRLGSGRCLQIIFRKNRPGVYFKITAYDLQDPELISRLKEVSE